MQLQLANIFLPLLFLLRLHMGDAKNTAGVVVVNQTPPSIHATEGSKFTIECTVSGNSTRWVAEWNKTINDVTKKLSPETDRIIISTNVTKMYSLLTVKKADVTDSGTYVCWTWSGGVTSRGNGTQVTIDEIRDLMVNQTPANVRDLEGSELIMNCTFKTVGNHSTMYVRWYNSGTERSRKELANESAVVTVLHLENGSASLTLKNVNVSNTGSYFCEVGVTGRNLSGNGTGTEVTIKKITDQMVNQTPPDIHKSEGSDLIMECRFTELKKHTMCVKWYKHNGSLGMKEELTSEGSWSSTVLDLEQGFASLTLKNVNVTNSGTYVCKVKTTARNLSMRGSGTQVNITAVVLLVTQTPPEMTGVEGENFTIECSFNMVNHSRATYSVTWYKNGTDGHEKKLKNGTGRVTTYLDSSKHWASLTLRKINRNDSGLYRCDFGENGQGNGTKVTVHGASNPRRIIFYIIGAVAGTLLFLVVLCICVWRWRQSSKGTHQSRPEAEMNQMEPSSPPQTNDVTYADLNFNNRETRTVEETLYTEVKIRPKQREDNAVYAKISHRHH